jgi:hypothetical protein
VEAIIGCCSCGKRRINLNILYCHKQTARRWISSKQKVQGSILGKLTKSSNLQTVVKIKILYGLEFSIQIISTFHAGRPFHWKIYCSIEKLRLLNNQWTITKGAKSIGNSWGHKQKTNLLIHQVVKSTLNTLVSLLSQVNS